MSDLAARIKAALAARYPIEEARIANAKELQALYDEDPDTYTEIALDLLTTVVEAEDPSAACKQWVYS